MRLLYFLFLGLVLWGCGANDKEPLADASAADAESTYAVTATEDGLVTVLIQFGGADAVAQRRLQPDEAVVVDGEAVPADSSSVGGVFYELQKPLADFLGTHVITLTKSSKALYRDSFSIDPFFVPDTLAPLSFNEPLVLPLENFTDTAVRVLLVDTDFASADINETYPVVDGRLQIPAAHLQASLVPGPAVLELYLEKEMEKGRRKLNYSYSVKRDVVLLR